MAPVQQLPGVASSVAPPTESERLERYLRQRKHEIDEALDHYLEPRPAVPVLLSSAMRRATLGTGKRLRPILLLAACDCCGGDTRVALPIACALEMIHAASLVHDDLPAMDNDDVRRGVPSLHKVYGEATAILAGDALIVYAFQVAAESTRSTTALDAIAVLAAAVGGAGMTAGQMLGLAAGPQSSPDTAQEHPLDQPFDQLYLLKSASLFEAALHIGGLCAGAGPDQIQALATYGRMFGLAFQVVDDILDNDADRAQGTVNYCVAHGREGSQRQATEWIRQAHQAILPLGERAWVLRGLADLVLRRRS